MCGSTDTPATLRTYIRRFYLLGRQFDTSQPSDSSVPWKTNCVYYLHFSHKHISSDDVYHFKKTYARARSTKHRSEVGLPWIREYELDAHPMIHLTLISHGFLFKCFRYSQFYLNFSRTLKFFARHLNLNRIFDPVEREFSFQIEITWSSKRWIFECFSKNYRFIASVFWWNFLPFEIINQLEKDFDTNVSWAHFFLFMFNKLCNWLFENKSLDVQK